MKNEKIVDGYSVSLPNFLTVTAGNDTSLRKIDLPVMTAKGVEHIYLTEKELYMIYDSLRDGDYVFVISH